MGCRRGGVGGVPICANNCRALRCKTEARRDCRGLDCAACRVGGVVWTVVVIPLVVLTTAAACNGLSFPRLFDVVSLLCIILVKGAPAAPARGGVALSLVFVS